MPFQQDVKAPKWSVWGIHGSIAKFRNMQFNDAIYGMFEFSHQDVTN
jgi:hypothetical protein